MRRFLDIIGSALLITIAVFGIYLCVFVGFKLSAEKKPDTPSPTPSEEITIDGKYYIDIEGLTVIEIKDENTIRTYNAVLEDGRFMCYSYSILQYKVIDHPIEDIEFEKYLTKETDKYIEFFVDETMSERVLIYDKSSNKLYYDFSGGTQELGKTYEDKLIIEMTKFTEYGLHAHTYSAWKIERESTLTSHGLKTRTCPVCGAKDGEELPLKEFVITIEENTLTLPEITSGTNNLYYREVGTEDYAAYVIGAVTSFDLTTLLTRDYTPMESGKTYEIYVMNDGPTKRTSNTLTYTTPATPSNESYTGYWLYDIEDAGTWVIRMTETTFEIAEATKVDGKYQLSGAFELHELNSNVTVGTHINLHVNEYDEVILYYDTATNLLVYGGMNATRITEDDVLITE